MTEAKKPGAGGGVLSSLPSTRPQRRSPKRAPARPTVAATTRRDRPSPTKVAAPPAPTPRAPVAAQGFNAAHRPVDPPSRTDLLGSVVSGAGEIAEIGLAAGRHVLRSIYGRLPHP